MRKIIAVVPTYNSADLVHERVAQLKESSFASIIVCDDKSDDNTVERLSRQYNDSIKLIAGQDNIGPGGNRNRILDIDIDSSDFLFFIDADCELVYKQDLTTLVAASFTRQDIGVVGFSICNKDDSLMSWNYGELMHPVHEAADQRLEEMLNEGQINREQFIVGAPARAASFRFLPEPEPKEVGWVAEGCFAVRTELFNSIRGFATQMRYHETHDFNARVQENGYTTVFNPTLVARHLAHDSRMQRRVEDIRAGRLYYYQTHWGMSEEVFARLFDE